MERIEALRFLSAQLDGVRMDAFHGAAHSVEGVAETLAGLCESGEVVKTPKGVYKLCLKGRLVLLAAPRIGEEELVLRALSDGQRHTIGYIEQHATIASSRGVLRILKRLYGIGMVGTMLGKIPGRTYWVATEPHAPATAETHKLMLSEERALHLPSSLP